MVKRLLLITAVFALVASFAPAADQRFFTPDKLIINGIDCTKSGGRIDLDTGGKSADIALDFTLSTTQTLDITRLTIAGRSVSQDRPGEKSYYWGEGCHYDPVTQSGVFRLTAGPPTARGFYEFSVDASKICPGAPSKPVYAFSFTGYPSIGSTKFNSLPAYTLAGLNLDSIFGLNPIAYARLSRDVPPSTSLYFEFNRPRYWPSGEAADKYLRVFLIKIDSSFTDLFRPVLTQGDLPPGEETLLYDAEKGGAQNGFSASIRASKEYQVWIRKPAPEGPNYQNVPYLEPGRAYSLQFELARDPYLSKRYEVSRFAVRPEPAQKPLTVTADYAASSFTDWQGDWFNGHLLAADDTPNPGWGRDFLLQKQMRDQYPDLWRTIDWYYPYNNGASMCFEGSNLFRDRSIRIVTKIEQTSPTLAVVTLAHFLGAQYYHDVENEKDRLSNHPVVANEKESIFHIGDSLIIQEPKSGFTQASSWRAATVTALYPDKNQLEVSLKEPVWPIRPEGKPHNYPAVLGPPGTESTTITLAGEMSGTYLRLRNGRPFVNWAILDHKFDFFVYFMGMRVSMHQEQPHDFVGDGLTGFPSAAGWQMVSDCEYYMTRHLLRRYHAKLGDFNHCIYGEVRWQWGGRLDADYIALYDYISDGILRAYEEVLGVKGDDYRKVQIGLGGLQLQWDQHHIIAVLSAHVLPAPLDKIFPEGAPSQRFPGDLPLRPLGSNPLYFLTASDRQNFTEHNWQYNACFLNEKGEPLVGSSDWDAQGKLTRKAMARITASGWKHSRWMLENTRYGKGSPFRQVSAEGYGHPAENLAKMILFEKEFLTRMDQNLRQASSDPYVQNYLQGVECGTKQLALFNWGAFGRTPVGRPWQGTGYWPTYFAEVMRRVLDETAKHPRGIYDHGTFTFDSFTWPDGNNNGCDSDVATFIPDTGLPVKTIMYGPMPIQIVDKQLGWAEVGRGKRIPIVENEVAIEKDVRHFIRFVGMMSHRLSALPEQEVNGHVISGIMSKYCERPGSVYETGNAPGDKKRFWALLYDHNPSDLESQDRAASSVTLQVRNLPKAAKSAKVTVYRVDRDHSSVFTLTEQMAPNHGPIYSASEIAALKEKAALAKDEDFSGNGSIFPVSQGSMDLPLTLGTNQVLFVEVDWGGVTS